MEVGEVSAYVVGKTHVDLLVRAAAEYGAARGGGHFRWHRVDEEGDYAGWRELRLHGECYETEHLEYVTPSVAGQVLVSENVRSVHFRYPDSDVDAGDLPGPIDAYWMGPYVYSDPGYTLSAGEVFAAIDTLDYQSCEHRGWPRSEAFALLRSLRSVVCQSVPGYGSSPGGGDWYPEDVAKRVRS